MEFKKGISIFTGLLFLFFLLIIPLISFADTILYHYDDLDRMDQVGYPDGKTVSYYYDNVDNRLEKRVQPSPVTGVTLSAYPASPQVPGAMVVITASASGGMAPYEYKFWLYSEGVWNVVREYSQGNSWTWNTTGLVEGTYSVAVWARSSGSSSEKEAESTLSYNLAMYLILDNGGPGTSYTGTWQVSGAPKPYGTDSLSSSNGTTYTWSFTPAVSGNYAVSMWWTANSTRSTSVPVDIQHSGGTTRVTVNQRKNGGKWNGLGTYSLTVGVAYTVTITSQASPATTCADAVKFTFQ